MGDKRPQGGRSRHGRNPDGPLMTEEKGQAALIREHVAQPLESGTKGPVLHLPQPSHETLFVKGTHLVKQNKPGLPCEVYRNAKRGRPAAGCHRRHHHCPQVIVHLWR